MSDAHTDSPIALRQPAVQASQRLRSLLYICAGAVGASLLILKAAPAPFFWLWVTWAGVLFSGMFFVRRSWPRAILLNVGIVFCMLAAFEAYLVTHEYTPPVFPADFYIRDSVLGWAPTKDMKVHAFKPQPAGLLHHARGVMFDTTYTIGSDGLRLAPPWNRDNLAGTILFFGCSYTFGEGLADNETLPYQVGLLSGERFHIFNFGFEGYNPAQMLAALENGLVRRNVDTAPTYAFYVAAPVHVWRVAGRVSWGDAPRYVLDQSGSVHQEGFYHPQSLDEELGLSKSSRIRGQLDKSALWRSLGSGDSRVDDNDLRLYFAVVRRSQELLTQQFPGIQFQILLLPDQVDAPEQQRVYKEMRDTFQKMGYPVLLVESILPNYRADRSRFILSPRDGHPSALADHLLAEYIANDVLPDSKQQR